MAQKHHARSNKKEGGFLVYLQAITGWLWIPLLLVLVLAIKSIPQYRRQRFFQSVNLRSYDGKIPRYRGRRTVNAYLKRERFRSNIPFKEWEAVKPELEMFYKRRIYKMEQSKEDIRIMDIYYIVEALPSFIPWDDSFMEEGDKFAIGESYTGKVVWRPSTTPHGTVAGSTGMGKSGILRCIIHQAILKRWNVQVFDFKGGGDFVGVEREAQKYRDLESGYGPFIISDPEETRQVLLALTIEVKGRLERFKEGGVTNITEYNASGRGFFVPWLLVIDEAAELLDVKPKDKAEKEMYAEIDHLLRTLARTSRAAGVHLLLGFIRPSADVLDGQIKNNLLWRVCGYFADPAASRIVLDNDRATELPPEVKGRFIIGEEETQAYYLPVPEMEAGAGGEAER